MSDTPPAAPIEVAAPIVVDKSALPANTANTVHIAAVLVAGMLLSKLVPQWVLDRVGDQVVQGVAGFVVLSLATVWRYLKTWRTNHNLRFLAGLLPDRVAQVKP